MSELTVFSKHIPINTIINANALLDDICLFNKILHTACAAKTSQKRSGFKEGVFDEAGNRIDLRKAENRNLKESVPESIHQRLKHRFQTNDYFTNSAEQAAAAVIKSQEELAADYVKNKEEAKKAVEDRLRRDNRKLQGLIKLKGSLVTRSRAVKEGKKPCRPAMPSGGPLWYDSGHDVFCLCRMPDKNSMYPKRNVVYAWANPYLFEVRYLDPEIKRLKAKTRSLKLRSDRLAQEIQDLKTKTRGICFGTRKLFKKRLTAYGSHETWIHAWRKARSRGMTLSGRKDAAQGNFMVRYNPASGQLVYSSQSGRKVIMNVVFPHMGGLASDAVLADRANRKAVAWRFERTHGSILVKCIVSVDDDRNNDFFGDGCISFDTNYDNLSVTNIDGSGNILWHRILHFSLDGYSSGHRAQILSNTLENVFKAAAEAHKPVAMENLKIKETLNIYGNKKRNRILSCFAYRTIAELAMSKSRKYGICVAKVSPAYTSQIGKIKFARKYGISVHEAAAACIGRRALGISEKVPYWIRQTFSEKTRQLTRTKQWAYIYKTTKDICVHDLYRVKMPRLA